MSKAGQLRRLQMARDDIDRVLRIWEARIDTLTLLADPLRGSSYDESGGGTGISDPTPAQAMQLARWHRMQADIATDVVEVAAATARLWEVINRVPSDVDTNRIAEQHRCNGMGQPGFDEWRWVGAGGEECWRIKDTRDGLCERCRQRRDHWRRKQEEAA